ncbi:MAG: hypothetical protein Q9227_004279 [Pyrenula ochraceoflavens]
MATTRQSFISGLPSDEDFSYDLSRRGRQSQATNVLPEKDKTEAQLEKLVFGDEAGFLEALKSNNSGRALVLDHDSEPDPADDVEEGDDLKDIADSELFLLDSRPSELAAQAPDTSIIPENNDDAEDGDRPAWEDSDDERIQVSLASNPRLRKLRNQEAEDVVSGKEYIKRLRRQFERLHPRPAWAIASSRGQEKKRKRRSSPLEDGYPSDSAQSVESDEEEILSTQPLAALLRNAGSLTKLEETSQVAKRRKLRSEVVDIQKTRDIPGSQPSSVDSLSFHPTLPLLLSSGPSSTVYLHHVSPHSASPSPLLTSLHLKSTPLHSAAFCRSRSKSVESLRDEPSPAPMNIVLTSRRRYFHTWNLAEGSITRTVNTRSLIPDASITQRTMESLTPSPCGRYLALVSSSRKAGAVISVLDGGTHQYQCSVRIDSLGGIASFAFWSDGEGLCVVGKNGEISEVSIKEQRVLARWTDEGAVGTTVVALGGDSGNLALGSCSWIAIGSSSGVVNVYDRRAWTIESISKTPRPKPTKVLEQLTTPVSHLEFSADSQMLAMASRWKKDALRLVHLPSYTVYRNWPTSETPLGRISSVALSPGGEYLAVGNERGKIRLWEIRG